MRLRLAMTCVGLLCMSVATVAVGQFGARDPGVRQGPAGTGQARDGLTSTYWQFYQAALTRFMEVDSVSGAIAGENGKGLGPRFNSNSCAGCHAAPTVGGSSPPQNPQISLATLDGAQNSVPSFITANGPTREARFINNPTARPMAASMTCSPSPAARSHGLQHHPAEFPAGAGAEQRHLPHSDADVRRRSGGEHSGRQSGANLATDAAASDAHRNSGSANHSGNDGTITRFGWKAQNKSLLIFAGEAYNVEQGVTNELFPNERRRPRLDACSTARRKTARMLARRQREAIHLRIIHRTR